MSLLRRGRRSGASFASAPVSVANSFVLIDVTALVNGWLASPATNFGIAIAGAGATAVLLDTKENTATSHPAALDVTVTGPRELPDPPARLGRPAPLGPRVPREQPAPKGRPAPRASQALPARLVRPAPPGLRARPAPSGQPAWQASRDPPAPPVRPDLPAPRAPPAQRVPPERTALPVRPGPAGPQGATRSRRRRRPHRPHRTARRQRPDQQPIQFRSHGASEQLHRSGYGHLHLLPGEQSCRRWSGQSHPAPRVGQGQNSVRHTSQCFARSRNRVTVTAQGSDSIFTGTQAAALTNYSSQRPISLFSDGGSHWHVISTQ